MIINIKFKDMKKLMELNERMLAYCAKSSYIKLLLSDDKFIYQCDVPFEEIKKKYHQFDTDPVKTFIKTELQRERLVEFFEEEKPLIKLETLQQFNPEVYTYDSVNKVLYGVHGDKKEVVFDLNKI